MAEQYPHDADADEQEFRDSELGQAIIRGEVAFHPEVIEAARLLREGTPAECAKNLSKISLPAPKLLILAAKPFYFLAITMVMPQK